MRSSAYFCSSSSPPGFSRSPPMHSGLFFSFLQWGLVVFPDIVSLFPSRTLFPFAFSLFGAVCLSWGLGIFHLAFFFAWRLLALLGFRSFASYSSWPSYINVRFSPVWFTLSLLFYTVSALLLRSLFFGALVGSTALRLVWCFHCSSLLRHALFVFFGITGVLPWVGDLIPLSLFPCPWWSSLLLVWCSSFCLG